MLKMCGEAQMAAPKRSRLNQRVVLMSADVDDCASDDGGPLPLERMSVVKPARGYKPLTFKSTPCRSDALVHRPQEDLRDQLQRRRSPEQTRECRSESNHDRRPEQSREPRRPDVQHRAESASGKPYSGAGATPSGDSHRSRASYVSLQQEVFNSPRVACAFPKFNTAMPFSICREDPAIVGRSEIWAAQNVSMPKIAEG